MKRIKLLLISLTICLVFLGISCGKEESNSRYYDDQIKNLEAKLKDMENRITAFESGMTTNNKEPYLKVISNMLNIRSRMNYKTSSIIAEAMPGAFLRKVKTLGKKSKWFLVDFLVNGFHYTGYISNSPKLVKEELYSPIEFGRVYARGLIKYYWEKEVVRELKKKDYGNIGIYLTGNQKLHPRFFQGHLVSLFRKYGIYLKPIQRLNDSDVGKTCLTNRVDAILKIEIEASKKLPTHVFIHLDLVDRTNTYLFSGAFPFQAIKAPDY